jgi:apolipoprotein N-acyltransferase
MGFVIPLVAGVLAALGHAPFHLWFLAAPGFALLIWSVSRGPTARAAFRRGWLGGTAYFAVTLSWIVEPFLIDIARHGWMAPFALVFLAGGLALFWGAAGAVSQPTRWPALGFAIALSLAELARGYVLTGFPWALPAYIWADTWLIHAAALVGPYGLTALTLLALALPGTSRRPAFGAGLAALVFVGLSAASALPVTAPGQALGTVRLVQPNAPQQEKWDPEKARIFLDRLLAGTAAPGTPDLIVWPETAIAWPLDIADPIIARAADAADGTPFITGINRRTEADEWFNSLIVVDRTGLVTDTYDKVHLVPFGEYIPFRIEFLKAMAGFGSFGFSPGEAVRLVDTPLGKALPLICYEAIFPRHGAGAGRPDYLLQVTNDAWFGTFSGPYQHLDQARFRAVEQGLPLVRAANTGVSAVIGPDGGIIAAIPLGAEGHIDAPLPAPAAPTLYSRIGDLPTGVFLLATLAALWGTRKRKAIASGAPSS